MKAIEFHPGAQVDYNELFKIRWKLDGDDRHHITLCPICENGESLHRFDSP